MILKFPCCKKCCLNFFCVSPSLISCNYTGDPPTPLYHPNMCSVWFIFTVQSYYRLLLFLSLIVLLKSFSPLSNTFPPSFLLPLLFSSSVSHLPLSLSFCFSDHWQLPRLLFAMQRALSFPRSLLSLLSPSQSVSWTLLPHPIIYWSGNGGGKGGAVYGVWEEAEQYFHKGYLRPLPLSSSFTIPGRHTVGS